MSMDHTVKCSKLQHGKQEAYGYQQGGDCDHQGKCFTEVMRTKARFSPGGEEKKQRQKDRYLSCVHLSNSHLTSEAKLGLSGT